MPAAIFTTRNRRWVSPWVSWVPEHFQAGIIFYPCLLIFHTAWSVAAWDRDVLAPSEFC